MYRLIIKHSAERDIRRLSPVAQEQIRAAIDKLRDNPRPPGVRRLVSDFRWRLRVGDYRVLYQIDDDEQSVTIDRVRHRREVYR